MNQPARTADELADASSSKLLQLCDRMAKLPKQHRSKLFQEGDHDEVHRAADELLLQGLRLLGGSNLVRAYERLQKEIEFWYA